MENLRLYVSVDDDESTTSAAYQLSPAQVAQNPVLVAQVLGVLGNRVASGLGLPLQDAPIAPPEPQEAPQEPQEDPDVPEGLEDTAEGLAHLLGRLDRIQSRVSSMTGGRKAKEDVQALRQSLRHAGTRSRQVRESLLELAQRHSAEGHDGKAEQLEDFIVELSAHPATHVVES